MRVLLLDWIVGFSYAVDVVLVLVLVLELCIYKCTAKVKLIPLPVRLWSKTNQLLSIPHTLLYTTKMSFAKSLPRAVKEIRVHLCQTSQASQGVR